MKSTEYKFISITFRVSQDTALGYRYCIRLKRITKPTHWCYIIREISFGSFIKESNTTTRCSSGGSIRAPVGASLGWVFGYFSYSLKKKAIPRPNKNQNHSYDPIGGLMVGDSYNWLWNNPVTREVARCPKVVGDLLHWGYSKVNRGEAQVTVPCHDLCFKLSVVIL